MSDYNYDKINIPDFEETNNSARIRKPKYLIAFLAGLGASIIVAIILAVIGIWLESEFLIALMLGAASVAGTIHCFVPQNSVIGAIIGAILCPATYLMYQFIMAMYGYYYEADNTFWWMLGGSVIIGAYFGYNKSND